VSPAREAAAQTRSPVNIPTAVITAVRRPRRTALFMIRTIAGPGIAVSTATKPTEE